MENREEINHPLRYNRGEIECIEAMEYICKGMDSRRAISLSNFIKYIWRCNDKGGYRDLDKAIWYLNRYTNLSKSRKDRFLDSLCEIPSDKSIILSVVFSLKIDEKCEIIEKSFIKSEISNFLGNISSLNSELKTKNLQTIRNILDYLEIKEENVSQLEIITYEIINLNKKGLKW